MIEYYSEEAGKLYIIVDPTFCITNEKTFTLGKDNRTVILTHEQSSQSLSFDLEVYKKFCLNAGYTEHQIPEFSFGMNKGVPGKCSLKTKSIELCLGDNVDELFFAIDHKTLYYCSKDLCFEANKNLAILLSHYFSLSSYNIYALRFEEWVMRYMFTIIQVSIGLFSSVAVGYYSSNIMAGVMLAVLQLAITRLFYDYQVEVGQSLVNQYSTRYKTRSKFMEIFESSQSIINLD